MIKEEEKCVTSKKWKSKRHKNLNQFLRYQTIDQNMPAFGKQIAGGMEWHNF